MGEVDLWHLLDVTTRALQSWSAGIDGELRIEADAGVVSVLHRGRPDLLFECRLLRIAIDDACKSQLLELAELHWCHYLRDQSFTSRGGRLLRRAHAYRMTNSLERTHHSP